MASSTVSFCSGCHPPAGSESGSVRFTAQWIPQIGLKDSTGLSEPPPTWIPLWIMDFHAYPPESRIPSRDCVKGKSLGTKGGWISAAMWFSAI